MELLVGKWKLPIINALIQKSPKRFKQLKRELTRITPTMLTTQLRSLETDCLVRREIFDTVPPTVEYNLTDTGKSISPMMSELEKWGRVHQEYLKNNI